MDIRPIETSYAGHRFRSRLEARWAVFFDAYGVDWHYEPQGYETPTGRYLPDFWLPDMGLWVEVKGHFGPGDWERLHGVLPALPARPDDLPIRTKARRTPVILLLGRIPGAGEAPIAMHSLIRWGVDEALTPVPVVCGGRFVSARYLMPCYDGWIAARDDDPNLMLSGLDCSYVFAPDNTLALAYERARRARFEHGEQG